jgi:hypothetical protein
MGTTYRFVAAPSEPSEVLGWFRSLPSPPEEVPAKHGATLYFRESGPLNYGVDGRIDPKSSPVVTVFLPQIRRGSLWTVGEVHFLATPLRQQFPALYRVSSAFSKWLADLPCVYTNKRKENEFGYYLEGSVKNHDEPVYAFDSGLSALQSGRYFVGERDNDSVLNSLCKALRLRGVECAEA